MTKSEICAIRDGVEITKGRGRGRNNTNIYNIPCCRCGDIIKLFVYSSEKEYLCPYCKSNIKKKTKVLDQQLLDSIYTPKEQKFYKAIEKMQKQIPNFDKYAKSIQIAKTRAEYYGSIPEVMVAVELIHLGYSIIPQQKIGKYRVDFCLPKDKLIIEVDGSLYHQNQNLDRDATINLALGMDWEIIHIPAEWISRNINSLSNIICKHCNTGEK